MYQKSASAFDGASGDVNANSTTGGSEQVSTALRRADDVTDAHASPGNRVGNDDVTSGVERRRTGGVRAEPARDVIHTSDNTSGGTDEVDTLARNSATCFRSSAFVEVGENFPDYLINSQLRNVIRRVPDK